MADSQLALGCGMNEQQERHRRDCEARAWLRDGYTSADKVDELISRIAKRRGQDSAEQLRRDMREQWRRRGEWLV